MRRLAFIAIATLLAVAGCDLLPAAMGGSRAGDRSDPLTTADTRVDEIATSEPGNARLLWRAGSEPTRQVTGNLTASLPQGRSGPLMLAFANGVTLTLMNIGQQRADAIVGSADGATFVDLLEAPPGIGVFLYRVEEEDIARIAPKGGLCGDKRTTFVAISEFVMPSAEWTFRIASFSGKSMPGPERTEDPQLCQTYLFAPN
jgi:hypothetical protein